MAQIQNMRALIPAAAFALCLVLIPVMGGDFLAYQIALFLIYGIATQGVALCWGRLGFLPLGHALFFGLGAYLTGGVLKAAAEQPWKLLALVSVPLIPAAIAWVVARLVFARSLRSGPYFSLITLAMTMLGFLAAQQWTSVTGGFNGLGEIPEFAGLDRYSTFYWVVAAMAIATTAGLGVLIQRPIGTIWRAISQSEERMQLFGYATDQIKANAYAFSAMLAGLAGGLFAMHQGIVTPLAMGFILSTEFVIWAAVGGKSSPLGAMLGAVLVGYASSALRDHFSYWEVAVAVLFILVVRFLPEGIAGLASKFTAPLLRMAQVTRSPAPSTRAPKSVPELQFQNVHCGQAGVRILNGLTVSLAGPGIRAVIGPNGAGKTSAFNALTGRLPVRTGKISLSGTDITGSSAWRVARKGVGRKLQIPTVFPDLTVAENLSLAVWAGRLRGQDAFRFAPFGWESTLLLELLKRFPELDKQRAALAGRLSQGHRQALELVMTLLPEPHLVLLDEPCAGLSPTETRRMIEAIQYAIDRLGAAALLIEHDLSAVAALGGEVYVLSQGKLLAQGSLEYIQSNPEVRAVYAGAKK